MSFVLIACQAMGLLIRWTEGLGKTNSSPERSLVTLTIQRFLACNLWRNKILCPLAFKSLVWLFKSFDLIARVSSVLHVMSCYRPANYVLVIRDWDTWRKKPWKFNDFLWLIIENKLNTYLSEIWSVLGNGKTVVKFVRVHRCMNITFQLEIGKPTWKSSSSFWLLLLSWQLWVLPNPLRQL